MAFSLIRTPPSTRTRLAAVLLGAVAVLAVLALLVRDGGTFAWDRVPVEYFDEHYYDLGAVRTLTEAAVWASLAAGGTLAVLLFCALLLERAYRRAAFWALTVVGVVLLTAALKAIVQRPEIGQFDTEYSFPSGNAAASVAAVAAFALLTRARVRRITVAAGAVVVPVYGVALVLLLWHYPSDVVAGWALGLALVSGLRLSFGDVSGSLPGGRFGRRAFRRSSGRAR